MVVVSDVLDWNIQIVIKVSWRCKDNSNYGIKDVDNRHFRLITKLISNIDYLIVYLQETLRNIN